MASSTDFPELPLFARFCRQHIQLMDDKRPLNAVRKPRRSCISRCAGLFLALCCSLVQASQTLTWCGYYHWPPLLYRTPAGLDGILMEQVALFAQRHPDITLEARIVENWKRCQAEVEQGSIDMIVGANQTPERSLVFDYVSEPAFVNISTVSAYAAADNDAVQPVNSLEELRQYRLVMTRGNSLGDPLDPFLETLDREDFITVNNLEQELMMVARARADYLIMPDPQFASALQNLMDTFPVTTKDIRFKKIFTLQRNTPAYVVFTKRNDLFQRYEDAWKDTIRAYYADTDLEAAIRRHMMQSSLMDE